MRRYARHILLPDVGGVGQQRLLAARETLAIASGRGAPIVALTYLAAAGVGELHVSGDATGAVTERDVATGIAFGVKDIGRLRVDALRDRLTAINPDVHVRATTDDGPLIGSADETVAQALVTGGVYAMQRIARLTGTRP